jgi:phosphoribosylformylglycinamidine synthase
MAACSIDEAVRRVVAVGGNPDKIGGVDNFCWPTIQYDPDKNPDGKYKAAQLVRANWALRDLCLAYRIPLLSGKDSMYIDGNLEGPFGERRKISGLPALMFTICSVIKDITKCITMDAKSPGDIVYLIGDTRNELGGSEFYQMMGCVGLHVPRVDANEFFPHYLAIYQSIDEGVLSSCHAVSRGGLAVHLAMVAMAGELGMEIDLAPILTTSRLTVTQLLYSESCGRFIVTVSPEKKGRFEEIFSGLKTVQTGRINESQQMLVYSDKGVPIIDEEISRLKNCWQKPFGELT